MHPYQPQPPQRPQQPQPPAPYQPPPGPVYEQPVYVPPPQQPAPQPYRSVTKQRKDTSHTFHLLMSVFTCGAWAVFVWLPIIIWHALGPRRRATTRHY